MAQCARRAGRQPTRRQPRRLALLASVLASGTVTAVIVLGGALPASAQATPDIVPSVACSFLDSGTGFHNTVWSYKNQTRGPKNDLSVPVGPTNRFDNPGQSAGQPTVFKPGTNQNAFIVTHRGASTWTLTAYSATAPGPACPVNPVPIVAAGWSGLVTIAIVTAVIGAVVFWQTRRRRRV